MKKRLLAVVCALTLVMGMSMTAMAAVSPEGKPENTETPDESQESPKTGEGDILVYGVALSALLAGTAVFSRRRLAEAR